MNESWWVEQKALNAAHGWGENSTFKDRKRQYLAMIEALGEEGAKKPWLYCRRHRRWAVRRDASLPWPERWHTNNQESTGTREPAPK